MKKRIFALILAFASAISFTSCADKQPVVSDDLTNLSENDTSDDSTTAADITDTTANTHEISVPSLTLPTEEDWEALGLGDGVWYYNMYNAVNALLSGDVDAFERFCGVAPGVYESFRGMVITDYTLTAEEFACTFFTFDPGKLPVLKIEVSESNSDYLTPGIHELVFDEGIVLSFGKRDKLSHSVEYPRAGSYVFTLGSDRDFDPISAEDRRQFGLCDFIVWRLNTLAGDYELRSEDEIREYAEKYLGVDGDTLDFRGVEKYDGGYRMVGRGGGGYVFTVLSEEVVDGINVVTVQFFADYSKIIPSRKVEFHMELLDGEYRPIKTVILDDSNFETAWS